MKKVIFACAIIILGTSNFSCTPESVIETSQSVATVGEEENEDTDPNGN